MSAVRAIRPAQTPPFIVDRLPAAKGTPKAAWRTLAEQNPGKWVVVKIAPGICGARSSIKAKGIRCATRRLADASAFGVNGPAVISFVMFTGQVPA